jgi:PAS domain S-box-containing protein
MTDLLYVDDEPALLDLGKTYLELSGQFRIDTATSVKDALVKVKQQKYAGIISDYQMPDMNGIEFLRCIRKYYKDLPFILFTGRGREEIAIDALNSGADFYLQKGGDQKSQFVELEYKIKNAIDRKRTHDELRESQRLLADIINFLPDATFAIDLEDRVIAWNRMMEDITGVSRDATLGKRSRSYATAIAGEEMPHLLDFILNKDLEIEKYYPDSEVNGDKIIAEAWSPSLNNGNGAHLWIVASPLYDSSGKVIGAIEAIRDITARKEAEEKMHRMNEELHAAYEQLTATEEELRQNYDELNRSQQDLLRSEERYRNVVEDQTEFICRFTPEGNLTFVNDAYCRYFRLNKKACLGKHHIVSIPSGDITLMKHHLSGLTLENPAGTIEHRIMMPDGEVRWQRWSDRAIFDREGKVIEYQSVGRDTTDRKEAEEALNRMNAELHSAYEQLTATEEELRQNYDELNRSQQDLLRSEERYRDVVEDQTEFICRFTPEGNLTFVNDAYCRYFRLNKKACLGKHHIVSIPSGDITLMKHHLSGLTLENPAGTIEHRIMMPDGEVRWQRWSDRAIFDREGKVIEYQSVGRDTTEQKEAEEALNRMNAELHSAYEQLTATEEELRQNYDELNRSQQDLLRSEERYRDVVEDQTEFICRFTPNGIHIFVNEAYCQYFGKDRADIVGHHFTPKIPGEDLPLIQAQFSSLTPAHPVALVEHRIVMPNGEVRWQQWSDRAIFDREGKIVEFQSVGRDITDRKRLDKALFETNRKLNLLSSITRHDILNQLTALQGYQDLLNGKTTDPECKAWINGAIRASEVIRSQVLFTRQYQDIGMQNPCWQEVYATAMSVCLEGDFPNVTIDRELTDVSVYADPLLKTVFYNLFENAIMHEGKMTKIQVSGVATPGGYMIVVEDDGRGIPPGDKKRIFEKGYGKHTGLGLFLVKEVLAITSISIEETGEYSKGARFRIFVPDIMLRKSGA